MAPPPLTNRNDEMEGDFLVQDSSCVLNLPIQKWIKKKVIPSTQNFDFLRGLREVMVGNLTTNFFLGEAYPQFSF